jgi:hypothetical protein
MIGYLRGPPPEGMFEQRSPKKWHGLGRQRRLAGITCRLPLSLDRVPQHLVLRVLVAYNARNIKPGFGCLVERNVMLRIFDGEIPDTDHDLLMEWDEILAPIQAWEAWQVAESRNLTLQGIVYNHPDGEYRIYEDGWKTGLTFELYRKNGTVEDLSPLLRTYASEAPITLDEQADAALENNCYLESLDWETVRFLFVMDRYVTLPHAKNVGWKVSDIWRLSPEAIEEQAKRFNLKEGSHLVTRLTRRNAAAKRKRTDARRRGNQ